MNFNFTQFLTIVVITVGVILSIIVGSIIGDGSIGLITLGTAIVFTTIWIIFARDAWWLAFIALGNLAGALQVGFRITPLEIGTLAALAPLIPYYVLERENLPSVPRPIPKIYVIAAIYFGFNLVMSLVFNRIDRIGDNANVVRVYSGTLSSFAIGYLFYHFASLRLLRLGALAAYGVIFGSLLASVVADLMGKPLFIPGINYMLDTGFNPDASGMEFFFARWSAVATLPFALFYSRFGRSLFVRVLNTIIAASMVLLTARAGGRSALLAAGIYVILWLWFTRQRGLILIGGSVAMLFVLAINVSPALLDPLPLGAQRSMSFLVFDRRFADSLGLTSGAGSDTWHAALRDIAVARWTDSWNTVLFGYGARGFEGLLQLTNLYDRDAMYVNALQAANTGAYEKSIYALLAISGLTGLLLILILYFVTARHLLRYLGKHEIEDERGLFIFLALGAILPLPVLGWIQGGLPQMELFYIAVALAIVLRPEGAAPASIARSDTAETYGD